MILHIACLRNSINRIGAIDRRTAMAWAKPAHKELLIKALRRVIDDPETNDLPEAALTQFENCCDVCRKVK